jgi:hypothetical protein
LIGVSNRPPKDPGVVMGWEAFSGSGRTLGAVPTGASAAAGCVRSWRCAESRRRRWALRGRGSGFVGVVDRGCATRGLGPGDRRAGALRLQPTARGASRRIRPGSTATPTATLPGGVAGPGTNTEANRASQSASGGGTRNRSLGGCRPLEVSSLAYVRWTSLGSEEAGDESAVG